MFLNSSLNASSSHAEGVHRVHPEGIFDHLCDDFLYLIETYPGFSDELTKKFSEKLPM